MPNALRIGCVGTSSVMNIMQDAIRVTDGVTCSVVYSRSKSRGEEYAGRYGIKNVSDHYDSFIARDDVDAVYIASPNSCHFEQGMQALENGKHVIMEKPLALTRREVDQLYSNAKNNGVFLFEAITTLYMPNYLSCRDVLPAIGKIRKAVIRYGQYSSKMDDYKKGIVASSLSPECKGGALNDMGIYCIHMAVDLFGKPKSASYRPVMGVNGVDLEGELTLEYSDFVCNILTSKQRNIDSGCRIEGEKGFFEEHGPINDFANVSVCMCGEEFSVRNQLETNRMVYELIRFRDAFNNQDKAHFYKAYHQSREAVGILEDVAVV